MTQECFTINIVFLCSNHSVYISITSKWLLLSILLVLYILYIKNKLLQKEERKMTEHPYNSI